MEAILQNILVNTYNPDKELRAQAEDALKNFIFAQGEDMVSFMTWVGQNTLNTYHTVHSRIKRYDLLSQIFMHMCIWLGLNMLNSIHDLISVNSYGN